MEHKIFRTYAIKIDAEQGIVEHIVAVTGNVDLGDDIIHPGAFTKTISERGMRVKCLDQHQTDSIMRALGKPLAMKEIGRNELPAELLQAFPEANGGLWVKTQFNLKTQAGHDAFHHIAAGDVDEWSIGYDPLDTDYTKLTVGGKTKTVRNLRTIKLYEYSLVNFGMNPATTTLNAKDAPTNDAPATGAKDAGNLSDTVDRVSEAFTAQYNPPMTGAMADGVPTAHPMYSVCEVWGDYIVAEVCGEDEAECYQVAYTDDGQTVTFVPRAEWIPGEYVFVPVTGEADTASETPTPETMSKAGRVQAARNQERIKRIMDELTALMQDAGMMDEPASDTTGKSKQAGPEHEPPTDELASQIDIELSLLQLIEV